MLEVRAAVESGGTKIRESNRSTWIILGLVVALVVVVLGSLCLGRYPLPLSDLLSSLFPGLFAPGSESGAAMAATVVRQVRLPRVACAVLVGAALSASGAAYQGVFRNPMVSPDILGASAGAGFGAALAILFSFPAFLIQGAAFGFGVLAVGISCAVSSRFGRNQGGTVVLILSGMVVATLFSSCISIAKYVADPDNKLPAITFWLMGSLASVSPRDIAVVGIPALLGAVPLLLARWRLNVLSFGDEEARAMGVDTARLRWIVILCSTLMTASSISICGMVGWVGLVVPHIARMLVGPDFSILLPVATLLGAIDLLVIDDIARTASAVEIPLGILTSLLGAPFFLWLLSRGRKGWVS
jgi:iron complex transport system permease protein